MWCGGAPFGRFPSRLRRRGAHLGGGGAAVDRLPRGERTGSGGLLCKGASAFAFAFPHPAHGTSPISGQGRGRRQVAAGRAHGQERGWPGALPTLRSALRPSAGGSAVVDKLPRGERTGRGGVCLVHSAFAHGSSPISGQGRGRRQATAGRAHGQGRGWPAALPPLRTVIRHTGGIVRHTGGIVRHCTRVRPPLPSPSPTLRTAARDTGAQRRGLFSGAARTLPGSSRRANDILYIRVRRREGENVLHRAAGNDVDNFSVDNPLWITAAAEGRNLRGRRRRLCGGSVNAGAEVQTRTGRVRKSSRAMSIRGSAFSAPWPRFHGVGRADVYNNTRAREPLRRKCVKPAALTTHSPPKTCSRPRTATLPSGAFSHSLPAHFRSPSQRRRSPAGCAMHSPPTSRHIPVEDLRSPPHSDTLFPSTFSLPPRTLPLPRTATMHARRPHNTFPAEDLLPSPHSDAPCPSTFSLPSRALPLPLAATMHARRLRDAFLAEDLLPPQHSDTPCPSTFSPPPRPDAHPQAARCTPADLITHSPPKAVARPRSAALPPLPFRFGHKKNGTAQWMCDAECLGRPSLRSVIGVDEPRAVRRRCGALAWRVGLRPQPWALRSRRCGRVLRA